MSNWFWLEHSLNNINKHFKKNYCPNCKQTIEPKKHNNIIVPLIGGLIFYLIFGLFAAIGVFVLALIIDSIGIGNKRCPICNCKWKRLEYRN